MAASQLHQFCPKAAVGFTTGILPAQDPAISALQQKLNKPLIDSTNRTI